MKKSDKKFITKNRKAYHDYFILEEYEAGMVLLGTEVKSIRDGHINLKDGYCKIENGEVFLVKCHISPYTHGGMVNHEPERKRKLLLNNREIKKLQRLVDDKGNTLIPLRVYLSAKGLIKLALGVAKGKKNYDKRNAIADKEIKRQMDRARKEQY